MDRNLTYVTTTEDFARLPLEDLQSFIASSHEESTKVYDLCNAILKWCREDTGKRIHELLHLLRFVGASFCMIVDFSLQL